MVIWLYCFLGFGATSGASGLIALTIGATLTTRAAELLKLQEQLFLNLAVLFPLRPLQGQTAVTRSTSPSWLSSHFQLKLTLILNWEKDKYQSSHLCNLVFGELGGRCWQVDSFHRRPETRQLTVVLAEVLIAKIFWDQFNTVDSLRNKVSPIITKK